MYGLIEPTHAISITRRIEHRIIDAGRYPGACLAKPYRRALDRGVRGTSRTHSPIVRN
jgi:hypothetical protein